MTRILTQYRRKRRPRLFHVTSLTNAVALVLFMTVVVCAQTTFASLYEDYFASTSTAIKIGLKQCLKCEHWESCWWGSCHIPIPAVAIYAERVWEALLSSCTTFEVLVRGFTLGFGVRMLNYLFWEGASEQIADRASVLSSFREKALVSAVAGLSLAAFLHGSSIFVPADVREAWFDYTQYSSSSSSSAYNTDVPLALYHHIRRKLVRDYQTDAGTLECPSNCDGEICNKSLCLIDIDLISYVIGRFGTGISYLMTTLEVLLRGFSLGFGARMLKFLFFPIEKATPKSNETKDEKKVFAPIELESSSDEAEDLYKSFQHRALVSAISGISVSAVVHGSSLFVPTRLRDRWFAHGIDTEDIVFVFQSIVAPICTLVAIMGTFLRCCCKKKYD